MWLERFSWLTDPYRGQLVCPRRCYTERFGGSGIWELLQQLVPQVLLEWILPGEVLPQHR